MPFESAMSLIKSLFFTKNIFLLAAGLLGVGFVIAFHELGHFLFCKLFNIKTPTFSIGMGPQLITKRIGQTDFTISAVPLGGYVEIANAPEDTQISAQEMGEYFSHKPYWQKMLVMSGGILFNLIFAYAVFIFLFFTGMPDTPFAAPDNADTIITGIAENSPAQKSLQINDKIIAINGNQLNNSLSEYFKQVEPLAHQKATFTIERKGQNLNIDITLDEQTRNGKKVGSLGITGFKTHALPPMSFKQSIQKGIALTHSIALLTMNSFKSMIVNRKMALGGPIMIVSQAVESAHRGFKIFLAFFALISINLAILNLIPLPILDGGQALFATIEAIFRRQLPARFKEIVMIITWGFLLLLTLYLSVKDISLIKNMRAEKTEQASQK